MPRADVHDRIKRRAYLLWEEEGRADHHWFRAEDEMTGIDAGGEAGPGTSGAGVHICPACEGAGRRGRKRCKKGHQRWTLKQRPAPGKTVKSP